MRLWLMPLLEALQRGEAATLVHVAALHGSGPREVGAQMLVTEAGLQGTIGGGELEHAAMLRGRAALDTGRAGLLRFALGPELGQCCGGAVTLAIEPFAPADLAWVQRLEAAANGPEPVFRTVRIDAAGGLRRDWTAADTDGADYTAELSRDTVEIHERMNAPAKTLWLFGAGHVGRAVVAAVAPLGFAITWIDARAGQFPAPLPPNVHSLALAMPELMVDAAPTDTMFLVMTHNHSVDETICEAVLRRGEFAYLGLIGSLTKRARFRKRLSKAGIPGKMLDRMTCPIGLPGIRSKAPAAIAASVAADLLMRREGNLVGGKSGVLHGH